MVDDGSTDRRGMICDEYAMRDKWITVCHQKNEGQATARNTGLRMASGERIGFILYDLEKSIQLIVAYPDLKIIAPSA